MMGVDYFRRRAIKAMRDELPPDKQAIFDKWAEGKPLVIQLERLTSKLMENWVEPEILKNYPAQGGKK
jgi:hypothetical protein